MPPIVAADARTSRHVTCSPRNTTPPIAAIDRDGELQRRCPRRRQVPQRRVPGDVAEARGQGARCDREQESRRASVIVPDRQHADRDHDGDAADEIRGRCVQRVRVASAAQRVQAPGDPGHDHEQRTGRIGRRHAGSHEVDRGPRPPGRCPPTTSRKVARLSQSPAPNIVSCTAPNKSSAPVPAASDRYAKEKQAMYVARVATPARVEAHACSAKSRPGQQHEQQRTRDDANAGESRGIDVPATERKAAEQRVSSEGQQCCRREHGHAATLLCVDSGAGVIGGFCRLTPPPAACSAPGIVRAVASCRSCPWP